jgi:hypothetical protein
MLLSLLTLADMLTELGVLAFLLVGVLLFPPVIYYFAALEKTMQALPQDQRPLPSKSIWLGWLPFIGYFWVIGYILLLSRALGQELRQRNPVSDGGLRLSLVISLLILAIVLLTTVLAASQRITVGLATALLLLVQCLHTRQLSAFRQQLQRAG